VQAERVERDGRIPQRAGERRGIALQALGDLFEESLLQGKDERRNLRRREPLRRTAARKLSEKLANVGPLGAARVELDAFLDRLGEQPEETLRFVPQLCLLDAPARDAPLAVWLLSHSARTSF
jgi:hypothetical protein